MKQFNFSNVNPLFLKVLLFSCFFLLMQEVWAVTYYLQNANVANASTPSSWKTDATGNGGGSAATSFAANNGDIFNTISGQSATFSASITLGSGSASGTGVILNIVSGSTSTINTGITITVNGKNANNSEVNVSGVIVFGTSAKVSLNDNDTRNKFTLASTGTLRTSNAAGVVGANCSIERTAGTNPTVTLDAGAIYEFNGATQATLGLPASLTNKLTINSSATVTLSAALSIANGGTVDLTAGTFAAGTNLTMASTSSITRSAGSITGTLQGAGAYDVTYTGTSKTTGIELGGTGLRNITSNLTSTNTLSVNASFSMAGTFTVNAGNDVRNVGSPAKTITMTGTTVSLQCNGTITGTNIGAGIDLNLTYTSSGTLTIQGSGGTCLFLNVINTNTTSTIALSRNLFVQFGSFTQNGILQLNNGGVINTGGVSPTYGASATLVYNQTGGISVAHEWTGGGTAPVVVGTGIPQNVTIQNSTTVTMPATDRGLSGNLSVTSGGLTLNATSGDLYLNGNWSRSASTTFTPAGRAVFFVGSTVTQTINVSGGETFNYFIINKTGANNVQLSGTDVTVNAASGNVLQLLNTGGLDINGRTLTLSSDGGSISVNSGSRTITSTATNGSFVIAGNKSVTSGGILNLGTNVALTINASKSLDMSTSALTMITSTLNGTGALLTQSTSTTPIPSGRTWPFDVTFNSGSNQRIPANTYSNLIFSGGSGIKEVQQDITISGNWTINSGTDVRNNGGAAARTVTMTGTAASLVADGTINGTNIGSNNDLNLVYTNASGVLTVSGGGALCLFLNATVNSGATLALARAFEVRFGVFTVTGSLRIDNGGSVSNAGVSPTYGGSSFLIYNSGTTYGRFTEWTATTGAGYPNNVTINAGSSLDLGNLGAATARQLAGNLIINGGLFMDFGANDMTVPLTVTGNLTLGATGTLSLSDASGGNLVIAGNWTSTVGGTFNPKSRIVTFQGTNTTLTGSTSFDNLTINKTATTNTLTLAASTDITVNQTLTLTQGIINARTNAGNVIVTTTGASVSGGGSGSYVNGNLRRAIAAGGSTVVFAIGDASSYTPASLLFSGASAGNTTVSATAGLATVPGNATLGLSTANGINRYWSISSATGGTYIGTYTYIAPGDNLGTFTLTNLRTAIYNGSTWSYPGVVSNTSSSPNVVAASTSNFGTVAFAAQRSVTASLTGTITKVYDAGTGATLTAANYSLSGVVSPDVVSISNTTGSYDTKNVGAGKTVTVTSLVLAGANADNYTLSNAASVAGTIGSITARALTITANTNTKTYDAGTSSVATPTLTTGVIQGGETNSFTQNYNNKNAGTGKTLTPSGIVNDGNSGNNYTYNFVTDATGVIYQRALTITANTNTKTYDAGTSSAAAPSITAGVVQGSETNTFIQSYDTKNAGTGKTLTPSGIVNDGNSGNNYTYSFVTNTTGVINQRALTITANTNTKTYDAGTSSAAAPSLTSGVIQGGETNTFAQTYDTKNAGTGKTLTPSGIVNDGNSGNNYTYNFVTNVTGVINQRALTITANTNTKTYDAGTSSAVAPSITAGVVQGGETNTFTQSYDNKNAGTGKTLTPSGIVNDGNSGNNYTYNFVTNTTGVINALSITVAPDPGQSKVFGNIDPTFTYSNTPALLGGDIFTGSLGRVSGESVGTYAYTLNTLTGGINYSLSLGGSNTFAITAQSITNADFRSKSTGNFTSIGTWQYDQGGSVWADATAAPASSNNIDIRSGHTIALNTNFTAGAGKTLLISSGGSLTVDPGFTLDAAATGTINFNGQPVTVRSTNAGTASIGKILGTLSNASNVTIERYLPQNTYRAWRLLAVPTKTSGQTIKQAWQENQAPLAIPTAPYAEYGTLISTGSNAYLANGFDAVTQAGSLRGYNGSAFASLTSVNGPIETTGGYFLFVRGNRTTSVNNIPTVDPYLNATATTLRTNGTLYQGTIAVPVNYTFGLVGNLYASEINFTNIARSNVDDKMYLWDAKQNIGGGYRTFLNIGSGNYTVSGGVTTDFPAVITTAPVIPSGHAFFVQRTAAGAASITLSENSKANGHTNAGFRPAATVNQCILSTILYDAKGILNMDGSMVVFGSKYNNAVDAGDAAKLYNPGENLAISRDGKTLAIETRQQIIPDVVIYFELKNLKQQGYRLAFTANNFPAAMEAYLVDNFLGTNTPVNLDAPATIKFTVTADAKSAAADRFKLMFRPSAAVVNNGKAFIRISPNPLTGSQLKLQFSNKPQGRYTLTLLDIAGRTVYTGYAQHAGGTAVQEISLPSITRGAYQLLIMSPDKTKYTQKILVNSNE